MSESVQPLEPRAIRADRRSRAASDRERDRNDRLHEMSESLAAPERVVDLLDALAEKSLVSLGAEVAIVVRPGEGSAFEVAAVRSAQSITPEDLKVVVDISTDVITEAVRSERTGWFSSIDDLEVSSDPTGDRSSTGPLGAIAALPVRARDRVLGGLVLWFAEPRSWRDEDRGLLEAVVHVAAQAWLRAEMHEAEESARGALEAAGQRLAFLAEASEVLAESLVEDETLQQLANLAVPRLADWCGIDMIWSDGTIQPVALAHVDPAKVEMARDLRRRYPPDPRALSGVPNVIRTGRSELIEEISPEAIEDAISATPEIEDELRELQLRSAMVVPLGFRGETFGAMTFVWAESGRTYTRSDLFLAEDLARRASVAIQNARLFELEREARREEGEARVRLQVLFQAGAAMAASLDVPTVLAALTGMAAGRLCDYSVAFLLGRDDRIVDAVGAHRDPDRVEAVERMAKTHLPELDSTHSIVATALRTGEPALVENVSAEQLERVMAPGEQLQLARELGFSSVIVAPLAARGRTLGALALIRAEPSPAFDNEDLSLATILAARAGLAIDNARLYSEREYIADTLQRSLLPPELPAAKGLEFGGRYLPASSEGTRVGGDFYDVVDSDDHWIAVIGDVVGKGAAAAAMTGLARYTIRTAAMAESRPSRILEVLSQAIYRQVGDQRFVTACCARVLRTGAGARATISCGGHPLPFIVHPDRRVDIAGSPGTILGIFEDPELRDSVVDLDPGDALVLYTDGVTDERKDDEENSEEFGEDRLRAVLSSVAGSSAQGIADGVLEAVVDFRTGQPRDDIAILVAKVTS